jgi:acyl-CoA thioesterase FadM
VEHFQRARFGVQFNVIRKADRALCVACRQVLAVVQMPGAKVKRLPAEWATRFPEAFRKDAN